MSGIEFNDDVYLSVVRNNVVYYFGRPGDAILFCVDGSLAPRPLTKLEKAKRWLKDNGGAHPGCLDRFMQARGMK